MPRIASGVLVASTTISRILLTAVKHASQQFETPAEHCQAILAGFEVLQGLHDRGVLELLRGVL